ncbi:MAG: response regulator, partial [Pseudomonadota bacterium]
MDKKATVLVVDDERRTRHSFSKVLKDECDVLLASRGDEAIEVFSKHLVDVVLLNTLLPDGNGIDLLEKFKAGNPNVKVIMISGAQEIHIAAKAVKLGACEVITKPFAVDDVIHIIRNALTKRRPVQEAACP